MAALNPTRTQPATQKITTFLWFDNNAQEAVNFYVSVFKNSRVLNTTHYGDSGAGPKGKVMTVDFELDGERFTALEFFAAQKETVELVDILWFETVYRRGCDVPIESGALFLHVLFVRSLRGHGARSRFDDRAVGRRGSRRSGNENAK